MAKKLQILAWTVLALTALAGPAAGRNGERTDPVDKAAEDAAKAQDRAARDAARAVERAQVDGTKAADNAAKDRADAEQRAAKDAADAADKTAKAAEDAAKDAAKTAEDAAKDAADAAEKAAKDAEDAAKEAAKVAEDAAKDAADAAEDATKDMGGSSEEMRGLASEEQPDFDSRGFPVRQGEIVGLDMDEQALASANSAGFRVIERTRLDGLGSEMVRLAVPKGMEPPAALELMRKADSKGSYDFTHYYGLQFSPQGTPGGKSVPAIRARTGSLKIGMIDTGVAAHKSLAKLSLQRKDFGAGKAAIPTEHGTAIASLLGGEGAGTIYIASVFRGGTGAPYTSADAIAGALNWMVEQAIPVINISLAGPRNAILDSLVKKAAGKGFVIVAAAGNGGPTAPPAYPAALPGVVAVTAVDSALRIYRYANQGRYVTVSALGVDVAAAAPGNKTTRHTGTSFAVPHIAAWLARCLGAANSAASAKCLARLEQAAKDLGEPGRDPVYGFGYVS